MKRTHTKTLLAALTAVAFVGTANASTILFDMGQTGSTTATTGWNNMAWGTNDDAAIPLTINPLVYSDGSNSTISATISAIETGGHGQGGFTGSGATTSPDGTAYAASVADHLWVPNGQVYTLTLSNLNPSNTYDFTFGISMPGNRTDFKTVNFAATGSNAGADTITEAEVEGTDTTSDAGWYWAEIDDISANGSNQIVLTVTGTGNSGRWSSLEITEVPEPSSLALLGLGGLCVLRRRRS